MHLKTICILLQLEGMFYICLLGPLGYGVVYILSFLLIFCLIVLYTIEIGILKFLIIIVLLSISAFSFGQFASCSWVLCC